VLPSGAAETLRLLFEGLVRNHPAEYEISQVGLAHCFAVVEPKWPVHPTSSSPGEKASQSAVLEDMNGELTLRHAIDTFQPDIVFALNDPQRLAQERGQLRRLSYRKQCLARPLGLRGLAGPAAFEQPCQMSPTAHAQTPGHPGH
jgi:hypothetical protein